MHSSLIGLEKCALLRHCFSDTLHVFNQRTVRLVISFQITMESKRFRYTELVTSCMVSMQDTFEEQLEVLVSFIFSYIIAQDVIFSQLISKNSTNFHQNF